MRNETVQQFRIQLFSLGCRNVSVKRWIGANGRPIYGSYRVAYTLPGGKKRICQILTLKDMQRSLDVAPAQK